MEAEAELEEEQSVAGEFGGTAPDEPRWILGQIAKRMSCQSVS